MTEESKSIPEEFVKVIKDFVGDIKTTFPEYASFINKWWKTPDQFASIIDEEERNKTIEKAEGNSVRFLFKYCNKKFPPRFFDILYQSDEMFKEESIVDTEFLPNIHFKNLWQCDITDKTRETIWKYLQLIMFSIVGTLDNKEAFGDTAKLFENINQDEFKSKLEETMAQMQGIFDLSGNDNDNDDESGSKINMPDAEKMHEHITGMLEGKLGQLAREIAEETATNLDIDFEGASDMKDIFQNLVKNPTKLMGLVKSVGDKLDSKIKSGELKETELIAETTDMMNKMKNMPGMGNIQSMLSQMGLGGLGGLGGKVDMKAMESNLNKKMKSAKIKEKIIAKAQQKAKAKEEQLLAQKQQQQQQSTISEEELIKLFSSGEKVERTPRGSGPPQNNNNNNNNNNNKKKKGK